MCSNYRPVTRLDRLLTFFGVERDKDEPEADVWPLGLAPFIRLAADGSGNKVVQEGAFGLLPSFALEVAYGRKTYNARSETVHKLNSFRQAWAAGHRCVIPAEMIFEPDWTTGRPVRWGIQQHGQVPMGIAGIYWPWKAPDGTEQFTFAMLTTNADDHPVMKRFHRPEDEKRMVIILDPEEYSPWLSCSVSEAPLFFKQWHGQLEAFPAALPPRVAKKAPARPVKPPPQADEPPQQQGLF